MLKYQMFLSNIRRGIPTRAVIWVMLFTCTFFLYMLRINLSIILLGMVEPARDANLTIAVPECRAENAEYLNSSSDHNSTNSHDVNAGDRFAWNSKLQGLILGAYFWGFVLSAIPGGALAERFGPARVVFISFCVCGALTLLAPLAADWHSAVLVATRFLVGLFGGVVYPSAHCLVSRWAPPHEKGRFVAALLGSSLGTVATWPALGAVVSALGWRWGFYASGGATLAWAGAWAALVRDSPADHPRISDAERRYIEEGLAVAAAPRRKLLPPYKSIFASPPMWGLIVLHFGNLWGLFFLMTAGPTFMSTVLGFDLGHTGFLAALPYLARFTLGLAFSSVGDLLLRRRWMARTTIRKSFVLFSHIVPGVLLLTQTLVGCRIAWTVALITLSLGSNGASTITNLQNSQDLAPNFAGTVYGIANCIGSVTGFISPLIVGYLTADHNGMDEWHTIFYIGASVYILCGIVFCLIGSGEIQPWNDQNDQNDQKGQTEKQPAGIENTAFDGTTEEIRK